MLSALFVVFRNLSGYEVPIKETAVCKTVMLALCPDNCKFISTLFCRLSFFGHGLQFG